MVSSTIVKFDSLPQELKHIIERVSFIFYSDFIYSVVAQTCLLQPNTKYNIDTELFEFYEFIG